MASAAGSLSRRSVSPTRRSAASSPPTTASRTQHESPPSSRSLTTSSCARLSARTSGYPRAVLYMPCHAMPCHAMPCHAMPCHAMHTWHACGHVQVRQVPLRPRRLRACMHAHTHAYVHAHVHACTHAHIHACMHLRYEKRFSSRLQEETARLDSRLAAVGRQLLLKLFKRST